jgi:hypothetical protein
MFRSPVAADPPAHVDVDPCEQLVPLSVLELDLTAPVEGWSNFLADRGISITIDDIGRASVSRSDARQLLTEQREAEVRRREKAAELERQAIEADQLRQAQIWKGVPAGLIPADVHPATAMLHAARDAARPRRESVLQHALSNSDGMTFHSYGPDGDES